MSGLPLGKVARESARRVGVVDLELDRCRSIERGISSASVDHGRTGLQISGWCLLSGRVSGELSGAGPMCPKSTLLPSPARSPLRILVHYFLYVCGSSAFPASSFDSCSVSSGTGNSAWQTSGGGYDGERVSGDCASGFQRNGGSAREQVNDSRSALWIGQKNGYRCRAEMRRNRRQMMNCEVVLHFAEAIEVSESNHSRGIDRSFLTDSSRSSNAKCSYCIAQSNVTNPVSVPHRAVVIPHVRRLRQER